MPGRLQPEGEIWVEISLLVCVAGQNGVVYH
jgi:hypothetical protein